MSRNHARHPLSLALLFPVLIALPSPAPAQEPPGAPVVETPYTLAGIDIYGNTRTPASEILALLALKEGDPITTQVVTRLDEKVRTSGKFAYAKVSSTGYGDRKSYLTVDIVEKGDERRFAFRPAPTGSVPVPEEVLDWVRRYEKASYRLFQVKPRRLKDINEGHYLDSDEGLRQYELKMLEMVPQHYDLLVRALREDRDPGKRSLCATILGWAKDKDAVIPPLQEALKDADVQVRADAARSLIPIAYLFAHTGRPFPMGAVFEQLQFPTSSDRTKAIALLLHLAGEPKNHAEILEKAGDVLVAMVDARQPSQREHAITLLTQITSEEFGRDAARWKSWWAARKKVSTR
jgi:hypothetical protein